MKKIHIVHIIPTLNFGGAERFVVDLANNLDRDKFEVSIIILQDKKPLKEELRRGVRVILVRKNGRISLLLFWRIKKILRELNPDIVHTHLFGGDFWGRVAARQLMIPVVTSEHNINNDEGIFKRFIKRGLKNWSEVYVAPSVAVADFIKKQYNIKKNILIIRHGIELNRFKNITSPKLKPPFKFLILGRLAKQKGHKIAIAALAQLLDYKWQLSIVGDGIEKKDITDFVEKIGLFDRIKFMAPTNLVPEVFAEHDVLLVPSRYEGLGIVALEGMAAGRLVVASEVDGLKEFIHNKETGLLFTNESINDLRDKLRWLMVHPHLGVELARAGRVFASKHFSASQMSAEYEKLYLGLVKHAKK